MGLTTDQRARRLWQAQLLIRSLSRQAELGAEGGSLVELTEIATASLRAAFGEDNGTWTEQLKDLADDVDRLHSEAWFKQEQLKRRPSYKIARL